jgi:hypothetical protein
VWLAASLHVNSFVPGFIVDYAAARALPRATTWLKPTIEAAQRVKSREAARSASAAAATTTAAAAR